MRIRSNAHRTHRLHSPRRGVAMLLVIVSLMMATVVTTAYLASRDNSGTIGNNVADSTSARWAADSGVELAAAILETEADWRAASSLSGGRLLDNYSIGGASLTINVTDMSTNGPPTDSSEYVQITSMATVNGSLQTSTATAFVPLEPGKIADLDLSEFAVFVDSTLTQSNQSLIARWPTAPLTQLGKRIQIGTRATSASSIVLSNSSAAIDTTVYHGPGASNALISNTASPELTTAQLLDPIPFIAPPTHSETYSPLTLADLTMNGGAATVVANSRYRNVELKNNAVRTLRGNITAISDQDFRINTGAKLIIDGTVKMVVFGNLAISQGSIELKPGARLRIHVRGGTGSTAVSIADGYIGELRADATRDNTGKEEWMDPQRITLFSMAPLLGAYEWRIERNSVIKGSIYSPDASRITLMNTSALYGRMAAKAVDMRDDAALFYDPALDIRCGFTNPLSPIYDADGRMLMTFKTLASLDSGTLQTAADLTGITVKCDTGTKSVCEPAAALPEAPESLLPTDPTPRPVRVEYDVTSFGGNVKNWEQ